VVYQIEETGQRRKSVWCIRLKRQDRGESLCGVCTQKLAIIHFCANCERDALTSDVVM